MNGQIVLVSDELGPWTGYVETVEEIDNLGGVQPTVVCTDPGKNPLRLHGMRVVCTMDQISAVAS